MKVEGRALRVKREGLRVSDAYDSEAPASDARPRFAFEGLRVWRDAMELAVQVYAETRSYPKEERFGLAAQTRRAAASISLNIAEGHGRGQEGDFARILDIAKGSLCESVACIRLGARLGYLSEEAASRLIGSLDRISRQLTRLKAYLDAKPRRPRSVSRSPET